MPVTVHLNPENARQKIMRKIMNALYEVALDATQTAQDCMDLDGGDFGDGIDTGRSRQAEDALSILHTELGVAYGQAPTPGLLQGVFQYVDPGWWDEHSTGVVP